VNKKTVLKIKRGIAYEKGVMEKEALLKAIKKSYSSMNEKDRARLLFDLKNLREMDIKSK
jgi:hypothetical protein